MSSLEIPETTQDEIADSGESAETTPPIRFEYLDQKIDEGLLLRTPELQESKYAVEEKNSLLNPEVQKQLAREIAAVSDFGQWGYPAPKENIPDMPEIDGKGERHQYYIYLSKKHPETFPDPINTHAKVSEDFFADLNVRGAEPVYEAWISALTNFMQEAYEARQREKDLETMDLFRD